MLFLGVDGGGSHLRMALCDETMTVVTAREYGPANPSGIGDAAARDLIRAAILETLAQANVSAGDITGIGIGIAGKAVEYAGAWLEEVVQGVLPSTPVIVPSSDVEIALVGSLGERLGVLVLAGTGSSAYGVNRQGESILLGGWGYLIGDEGSGYWIGAEALRVLTRVADERPASAAEVESSLSSRILERLGLETAKDVIAWLYHQPGSRVAAVAQLAELVLAEAARGDACAGQILDAGALALAQLAQTALRRLGDDTLPIAFAGGLLAQSNLLSERLRELLGLTAVPSPRYPPVIGGALLAQQRYLATSP